MSIIRWIFMSKYQKLMYNMQICRKNKQRLHLSNGLILDFENMTIEEGDK